MFFSWQRPEVQLGLSSYCTGSYKWSFSLLKLSVKAKQGAVSMYTLQLDWFPIEPFFVYALLWNSWFLPSLVLINLNSIFQCQKNIFNYHSQTISDRAILSGYCALFYSMKSCPVSGRPPGLFHWTFKHSLYLMIHSPTECRNDFWFHARFWMLKFPPNS